MKIWTCKIVVLDENVPDGFDYVPRKAAIEAVLGQGMDVAACFSGWDGKLTETERMILDESKKPHYPSTKSGIPNPPTETSEQSKLRRRQNKERK